MSVRLHVLIGVPLINVVPIRDDPIFKAVLVSDSGSDSHKLVRDMM